VAGFESLTLTCFNKFHLFFHRPMTIRDDKIQAPSGTVFSRKLDDLDKVRVDILQVAQAPFAKDEAHSFTNAPAELT
jgi:hypothetical protein